MSLRFAAAHLEGERMTEPNEVAASPGQEQSERETVTDPNEVGSGPGQEQSEGESSVAGELNIGPRVTAVFTAAERAAQHIVTMAREEADDLRRRAEAEAESLLSQRRYQAEEEASRRIADAQAQADQIRAAAEAVSSPPIVIKWHKSSCLIVSTVRFRSASLLVGFAREVRIIDPP